MSASSRTALHVLRLVLRSQPTQLPRRAASSAATAAAALVQDTDNSSSSSSAPTKSHAIPFAELTARSSFLESESDEYTTASLLLPAREVDLEPIPWPTLFPHAGTLPPKSKFCDPIFRLVSQDRYKDALLIYSEILSHNDKVRRGVLAGHSIRIQHRHAYLRPAIHSLKKGDHKSTLMWLGIYPNRPATYNHPALKSVWAPMIEIFINDKGSFRDDPEFLAEFLVLAGRKGLLPTLLPPILPHLTFAFPPEDSTSILGRAIQAYRESTTSDTSDSARAQYQEEIVDAQIAGWWGSYLRKLIIAGWKDQARYLVDHKPFSGEWDGITRKYIQEELEDEKRKPDSIRIADTSSVIRRIRSSLVDLPTPTELATLLRALSHPLLKSEHPTLAARYKSRFTRPPSTHKARRLPTIQQKLWIHAEILNLQLEGRHQDAVDLFRDNFIWIGLPDQTKIYGEIPVIDRRMVKSYPSIHILTSVIPSIIYTLPHPTSKSAQTFYSTYIDSINTYPPSLRPTSATYSTLLRELTYHAGSLAGLRALRALTDNGIEPGQESYAAVLYALAGRRQIDQFWSLFSQAERENMLRTRTYRGLVAVLVKTGLAKDAEKVFWRAKERYKDEDVFEGLEIATK
ncbi:uncharacterized protein I303_107443 [Kwoniella dejecticola CBS 10117]|uniref:Uncharacterized protein n=1 Tax=Kwoniella dejecticola CBS 10117 TaxID=1296121 RepID=A0A1A5ZZQ4_9TREE|nr:uncharacterized protein I303_06847 [Kwoniella dejecticola CBS 10117]OBR83284.1 hypothetical protein I303_06847 [Kwoniella dejecticola CBS 10117]